MIRWTSGPVCGINNCTSRQWRIVDGQSICRNGHVREGDVEIVDDEFENMGRAFRATKSQLSQLRSAGLDDQKDGHTRAIHQAHVYFLKFQAEYVVKEKGVPSEIMPVARALMGLWLEYVKRRQETAEFEDSSGIDSSGIEFSDYSDEEAQLDKRSKFLQPLNHLEKSPTTTKIKYGRYRNIHPFRLPVKRLLSHSILWSTAILYISACVIQYPLYLSDLLRWIHNGEIPLYKSTYLLPDDIRTRLNSDSKDGSFKLIKGYSDEPLADQVLVLGNIFRNEFKYSIPNISLNELTFKIIYMLYLPPELYMIAINFSNLFQIEFDATGRDPSTRSPADDSFLYAIIVLLAKLIYGFDHIIRHPKNEEPGREIVDWELWLSLITKSWIDTDSFVDNDPNDALFWDTEKLSRCLDWAENILYAADGNIIRDTKKRVTLKRYMRKAFTVKDFEDDHGNRIRPEQYAKALQQRDILGDSILFAEELPKKKTKGKKKTASQSQLTQSSQYSENIKVQQDLDSEEELRANGVKLGKLTNAGNVIDKDLYSSSNPNIADIKDTELRGTKRRRKHDTTVNTDNEADDESEESDDSDNSGDFDTFAESYNGYISRLGELDIEDPFEDSGSRQKPIQPTDQNLMEINQLIQSTTMEYDMQLTKFTDHVKQHRQKLWKGQQTANNDTEDVSATKSTHENDWEDTDAEASDYEARRKANPDETYVTESYEDALLYPNDMKQPETIEYHHNKFMAQKAREGVNSALKYITKYPEYVHSSKIVDPVESARMDLRNTRYMGRRLRPGHRFTPHKFTDPKDNELVQALLDAAPAVIGASPSRIEDYLIKIESKVMRPNIRKTPSYPQKSL